jgi:hypothetical protein
MMNKPFEHGTVIKKDLTVAGDSVFNGLKTMLKYAMQLSSYSNILIYIQQDAMLHSLFYLETALHVSGGTTTHHQERKQLYLQHLVFVTTLLLPAAR